MVRFFARRLEHGESYRVSDCVMTTFSFLTRGSGSGFGVDDAARHLTVELCLCCAFLWSFHLNVKPFVSDAGQQWHWGFWRIRSNGTSVSDFGAKVGSVRLGRKDTDRVYDSRSSSMDSNSWTEVTGWPRSSLVLLFWQASISGMLFLTQWRYYLCLQVWLGLE